MTGNHDVPRLASRYRLDEGFTPEMVSRLIANGGRNAAAGFRRARAAALVLLALPGSAYLYQGEELGLPEVTDIPDDARQDPRFFRTKGEYPGRDGCRVPLPWAPAGADFGFSRTGQGASPSAPWLPQPPDWGSYSVESQLADEHSFLHLYRAALRLRRDHPALGRGTLRWLVPATPGCCASPGIPASSSPSTSARAVRCPPTARSSWPAGPVPGGACRPIPPPGCPPDTDRAFSSFPAIGTTLGPCPRYGCRVRM